MLKFAQRIAAVALLGSLMASAGCFSRAITTPPVWLPEASATVPAVLVTETTRPLPDPRERTASPSSQTARESEAPPSDNTVHGWYYTPNAQHRPPRVPNEAATFLARYRGRYLGPDPKLVYLTFDAGYENGQTTRILDALAHNHVRATFFVTESYIRANPDLVRRMVREGHTVGNHSATHPSMPSLASDPAAFARELERTEAAFREVTGTQMARVFRPPKGEYSALSLYRTAALGYESVFWSFAHRDWLADDQPPPNITVRRILDGSHPGAIYLLHAVSSSNADALDEAIEGLRRQGYGFGTLGS
ncbi:MAG: polysaccharide deacetylase family protein [Coriobacteriia bacterium]|nr:polysaccharide deacetylase family protein [Coriobacteriia bacterium]